MTTKEKIEALDNLIGMVDDNHGTDYDDALKSAKRSLEAWDKVKTNGDAIKMMFPYGEYGTNGNEVHVFGVGGNGILVFTRDWWNAPYKESEEE